MTEFTFHDETTAPEESRPLLEKSKAAFGRLPGLHKVMAEAPGLLNGYKTLWQLFGESSLSPVEQQVVYMTANFENNCAYCVPWHTYLMVTGKMPADVIEALRNGTDLPDPKLQALHVFAKGLLDTRGHVGDDALQAFLDAGYENRQALEVVLGLAVKLMSNFTNAIAHTELDDPPKAYAWTKPV